jgi:predicted Na+-dependent transporter
LLEFFPMLRRLLLRLVLPAILGSTLGFFALALAVEDEPSLPVPVLSIFSPGLEVAEMIAPAKHESLGSTFGGFLRIAIGVNAVLYFSIFALAGYLIDRRLSRSQHIAGQR